MLLYSKKADIGMIEMVMVLIIILVILTVGMVFYYKFYVGSIKETGVSLSRQQADVLLATITSLPELQCSTRGITLDCVDLLKVSIFKSFIKQNTLYYSNLFGFKTISVIQLCPKPLNEVECHTDSSLNSCNEWIVYSNPKKGAEKEVISTPVSLFNPSTKQYLIGKLIIEVYR